MESWRSMPVAEVRQVGWHGVASVDLPVHHRCPRGPALGRSERAWRRRVLVHLAGGQIGIKKSRCAAEAFCACSYRGNKWQHVAARHDRLTTFRSTELTTDPHPVLEDSARAPDKMLPRRGLRWKI
jgi:hypothetical protein